MSTISDAIINGNIDQATRNRVYRLFTTPAGSVPFDRNFGIDLSVLDDTPAAVEGTLLVEYTQKLMMYFPELTISQLTFSFKGSSIIPEVVIANG